MDVGYWHELLRSVMGGRKIVVTGVPTRGAGDQVDALRELGASDVFVLGEGEGTGALPDCAHHELNLHATSVMEILRAGQAALRELPPDARTALDYFDPAGNALVIGSFLNETPEVAGRRCLMHRRPEWIALEDKLVADDVFDAAQVPRADSRIVPIDALAWSGKPEVWAGDALGGFHGGAEHTHLVRSEDDAAVAIADLRRHCRAARAMPFLDGIPCSIHGVVIGPDVIALRPVEMVTLRRPEPPCFFYAGAATFWDPPDVDRHDMRDVARRVGAELRNRAGFQGAFTVDGVMTDHGFRPTEINPRMGAGLRVMERVVPEVPIHFLVSAIAAGLDLDYRPAELESLLVERTDAKRGGGTWKAIAEHVEPIDAAPLTWTGTDWHADDSGRDGTLMAGSSEIGGFLRLVLHPTRTPSGPSIGDRAVAFYAYADRELGTTIGPLDAAPSLRE